MKTLLLSAGCLLLITGCTTNPANDPLQVRLNDIDTRLGSVERVVSNQSLVELSRRLDALEAQQLEQRHPRGSSATGGDLDHGVAHRSQR